MDDYDISKFLVSEQETQKYKLDWGYCGSSSYFHVGLHKQQDDCRGWRETPPANVPHVQQTFKWPEFKANSYVYTKPQAAGGVVMAGSDRSMMHEVYLIKPSSVAYGVDWTFPKGKADKDESLIDAALREVLEESGIEARLTCGDSFLGKGEGLTSETTYYLMVATGGHPSWHDFETGEVTTMHINQVIEYFEEKLKCKADWEGKALKRDLAIAKAAKVMIDQLYAIQT
jgi:8-oxo-dGTP pyrophosphatase MutT (NUDIX family)